jgi:pilus assembly protein CpaE
VTLLIESDPQLAESYAFAIGRDVHVVEALAGAHRHLDERPDELLVVVGPSADLALALELASALQVERPQVGVVLVRRRVDVAVLGQALRAGVREVITPDDLSALGQACRRSLELSRRMVGATAAGADPTPEGKVVTVFAAKGGCGKTTIATNLAFALSDGRSHDVCILDLDLAFGDVAIALQLMPARTIVDAVQMGESIDEMGVRSLVTRHSAGVDTILAPLEPGEAERVDVSAVAHLVRMLKRMYRYVVIDTPPAFSEHVLAAFDLSDAYVLLATLDVPALKNLRLTLDMLDLLGYPRSAWLVALNRSDSKVGLDVDEVEKTLRSAVSAQIPSSRAVSASINRGVPIVLDEPGHPVSVAVRDIADQLRERLHQGTPGLALDVTTAEAPGRRRFGLLRRGGRR